MASSSWANHGDELSRLPISSQLLHLHLHGKHFRDSMPQQIFSGVFRSCTQQTFQKICQLRLSASKRMTLLMA